LFAGGEAEADEQAPVPDAGVLGNDADIVFPPGQQPQHTRQRGCG
jgi:hypothetical protein